MLIYSACARISLNSRAVEIIYTLLIKLNFFNILIILRYSEKFHFPTCWTVNPLHRSTPTSRYWAKTSSSGERAAADPENWKKEERSYNNNQEQFNKIYEKIWHQYKLRRRRGWSNIFLRSRIYSDWYNQKASVK